MENNIPVFEIRPIRSWIDLNLRDLWEYRELLYTLIVRDVKVRYKQTVIGVLWVILQPILTMVLFSLIFGQFAQLPSNGMPYPLFVYTALLPWQLFARALSESSISLVANQSLITKVYFPRLMIPFSAVLSGLVDFGVALIILIVIMVILGIIPTLAILALPFFFALAICAALAVGLWLSALNVQYRDVVYTIPFITQFWFFATPIAYTSSLIPEKWRWLYGINPMVGVVEGFRWALIGMNEPDWKLIIISTIGSIILLITGLAYFRRMEDSFADKV